MAAEVECISGIVPVLHPQGHCESSASERARGMRLDDADRVSSGLVRKYLVADQRSGAAEAARRSGRYASVGLRNRQAGR